MDDYETRKRATVPLIGIIERFVGVVRKALGDERHKSRGSLGGANGGSMVRLATRFLDAQRDGEYLRRHSASLRASLHDAVRRSDRDCDAVLRAEGNARQASVRDEDA